MSRTPIKLAAVALLLLSARARAGIEEDLAALRTELAAMKAATDDSPVRFYGFLDGGLQKLYPGPDSPIETVAPSTANTFVLGNINLYADAQVGGGWSALLETRLTSYPNGNDTAGTPAAPYQRADTTVFDVTNPGGAYSKVRWGGIILERAYGQWRWSDGLQVRLGLFLTPFGIWNIDHGTPTLISLMLPQFEIQQLFPIRQVGMEVLGTRQLGPAELGYFAYVSNGRTPGQVDPSDDKMVGGRAYLKFPALATLTVGASFFRGRYVDTVRNVVSFNPTHVETTPVVAYDEHAEGLDVSLDVSATRVRSELVHRQVVYDAGKRELVWERPGVYAPDHHEWDWYGLVAHQLPWVGLEPFVYVEAFDWPTPEGEGQLVGSVGLNLHLTASVQIKTQVAQVWFFGEFGNPNTLRRDYLTVASRLVVAF